MPIKYYPKSRIKTNLYTKRNYYVNGKPYVGPYYLTYTGDAYTGNDPLTGDNQLLSLSPTSTSGAQSRQAGFRLSPFDPSTEDQEETEGRTLKQLTAYKPTALEEDYEKRYFKRYFVKRIVDKGYIMEVDYSDWLKVANRDVEYEDYEAIEMMWQLVGPLHDTRVSQYEIKAGVYDTNKRITEKKAKTFIGLVEFIGGDYIKFARITD